ncbi:MAG: BrnT family toxin [Patescibacteria group bacterium]
MNLDKLVKSRKGFDWDDGNKNKNWIKHKVSEVETEEAFLNEPLIFSSDKKHSDTEIRYKCLGQTNKNRKLFISFTIRSNKIRVISARDQDKKERKAYEKS